MIKNIFKGFKKEYLRIFSLAGILLFSIIPLFMLFLNIKPEDFTYIFNDKNFYSALLNSIIYSLISASICTLLSIVVAYLLNRANIKHKNSIVVFLTFGMLVPSLSIGLGIRVLFGTNGFLHQITGININSIGFLGLILGSIITAFPTNFLLIYDALRYEDKRPYDAAQTLGIPNISTFFKMTLPYLKVAIISAFFASFTLIFSDYGVPMEVAGKIKTLPMYLYEQVLSTYKYGRGSIVSLFLLLPSLTSFVFDLFFKEENSEEKNASLLKSNKTFNIITLVVIGIVGLFLIIPQLSFVSLSFIDGYPRKMIFSLDYFKYVFTDDGVLNYILNSVLIALGTAIIGTVVAYTLGYLTARKEGKLGKILNLLSVSTIAIPGLVLGLGYIFLFKFSNGFFYGTILILIVVNIFHFIGSPYIMARNCLSKINKEYEVIGETLGISKLKIIFKVLIPQSKSTLIEMFSYFFINGMVTISAVSFLCTYYNQPLSILINAYGTTSDYEIQAVISVIILIINLIVKISLNGLKKLLNKRSEMEVNDGTKKISI